MADGYLRRRRQYQDISGTLAVNSTGTTTTVKSARSANYTLFIQRWRFRITTGAAQTWSVQDTNSSPLTISGLVDVSTAPSSAGEDFGPEGVPLTAGKNLTLTISAAGAAGIFEWEGYQKPTSTIAADAANTVN